MAENPSQQMFDLWRKGMEESAQAWTRLLSQSPAAPPDPAALWRPVVEQWVQAWARMLAQTPMTPDVATQWKQFLDQSIETWSRAMGQAMHTDAFARALGGYLDQWLAAAGPVKKALEQSTDQALTTLGLASRAQLTGVARQIVDLEERLERVEDAVALVLRRLEQLAAPAPKGAAAGAESRGPERS
jgi:hypothetical protein